MHLGLYHLPPPTNVREVRSFVGHAGFYRRFIKDFSKITISLCKLLQKDVEFHFDDKCKERFETLELFWAKGLAKPHMPSTMPLELLMMPN